MLRNTAHLHLARNAPLQPRQGLGLEGARAIHFIDIENLARNPRPTEDEVRRLRRSYVDGNHFSDGDLIVLACNHLAAPAVRFGWPEGRLIIRSGPNGADLALLDAMAEERLPERFTRVVVASGDGIFTEEVSQLGRFGVEVTIVAPNSGLSARLRLAAAKHKVVDPANLILFPESGEAA